MNISYLFKYFGNGPLFSKIYDGELLVLMNIFLIRPNILLRDKGCLKVRRIAPLWVLTGLYLLISSHKLYVSKSKQRKRLGQQ